jgi:hypothetical protein
MLLLKYGQATARCASNSNPTGGKAVVALSRPTLIYDLLVGIANRLAPPGKSRRRMARKLNCAASMVPDAFVCYATIYALVGLMILLYLRGLIVMFGG